MEDIFYVAKDEDGVLRPMWFVTKVDAAGEMRKKDFLEKNKDGTIVKVKFQEVE